MSETLNMLRDEHRRRALFAKADELVQGIMDESAAYPEVAKLVFLKDIVHSEDGKRPSVMLFRVVDQAGRKAAVYKGSVPRAYVGHFFYLSIDGRLMFRKEEGYGNSNKIPAETLTIDSRLVDNDEVDLVITSLRRVLCVDMMKRSRRVVSSPRTPQPA